MKIKKKEAGDGPFKKTSDIGWQISREVYLR